jgi:hypothetical protein
MAIKNNFPSIRPSLNLDFANTKSLDPRIAFTRTSTATYFDQFGVLKTAPAGQPRFDHDPRQTLNGSATPSGSTVVTIVLPATFSDGSAPSPVNGFYTGYRIQYSDVWYPITGYVGSTRTVTVTGSPSGTTFALENPGYLESLGLLIEEQRMNLLTRSEQFDNEAWAKPGEATAIANISVAPDGTLSADKLVEFNGSVNQAFEQTATLVLGTAYAISIYAKAAERTQFRIAGRFGGNWTVFPAARIDLTNGTVLNSTGDKTATVESVGNGWYRCTVYGTSAVGTSGGLVVSPLLTGGTSSVYQGDGTSGIFIWGAQLESGAFPTSYIPTTATAVTRNPDIARMSGVDFSSWYNQSEGTFVYRAKYAYGIDTLNSKGIRTFECGNASSPTEFFRSNKPASLGALLLNVAVGGTSVYGTSQRQLGVINANTNYTVAMAMKSGDSAGIISGNTLKTDATTFTPPAVNMMEIGDLMTGHIARLTYYPKRLPDATLQALTK